MRVPCLPTFAPVTTDRLRRRAVGAPAAPAGRIVIAGYDPRWPTFGDWLREHPEDRVAHAAAKIRSAERNRTDMPAYVAEKASTIIAILRRAGLT